jgi:hypothetical protein
MIEQTKDLHCVAERLGRKMVTHRKFLEHARPHLSEYRHIRNLSDQFYSIRNYHLIYLDFRIIAVPDLSGQRDTNSPFDLQNSSTALFAPSHTPEE